MRRGLVFPFLAVLAIACGDDGGSGTSTTTSSDDDDADDGEASITLTTLPTSSTQGGSDSTAETQGPTTTAPPDTETTDPSDTGTTDPGSSSGDEAPTSSSGSTGDGGTTVYDVQDGTVAEDVDVTITGPIVTALAVNGFWMQEPPGGEYSGIFVFVGGPGPTGIALGDGVEVTGTTAEFFGRTEINAMMGDVTVLESPGEDNVPDPESLAITALNDGEVWESVFVRIDGDTFTVTEIDAMPTVEEFYVENAGGNQMRIDDFMFNAVEDLPNFDIGSTFTAIQGPLNFNFDEFKIAPRVEADLEGFTP